MNLTDPDLRSNCGYLPVQPMPVDYGTCGLCAAVYDYCLCHCEDCNAHPYDCECSSWGGYAYCDGCADY